MIDRFISKLKRNGECLEWTASTDTSGYGLFKVKNKLMKAHRFSYQTFVGEIPDGMYVMHKCDNRICVLPSHLQLGTHQDNMDDKVRKGRQNNGRLNNTHCPKGHPYSGENLFYDEGARRCRICTRLKNNLAYRKRKNRQDHAD